MGKTTLAQLVFNEIKNQIEFKPNCSTCSTSQEIAKKCKGMPLAAKTIGGLLHFKTTLQQWENVLNSEVWDLKEVKEDLFPLITLSYNELEPATKRCFSYCAIFPKDTIIDVDHLIRMWMAQGFLSSSETIECAIFPKEPAAKRCFSYCAIFPKDSLIDVDDLIRIWMAQGFLSSNEYMEQQGQEYFQDLAKRSFFQDFEKDTTGYNRTVSCKMHDILHDFAQFLTKNECLTVGEVDGVPKIAVPEQNIHHLNLMKFGGVSSLSLYPKLRSLFSRNLEVPPNWFSHLKRVRLLSLGKLEDIPKEIGDLIHIRYLDVSENSSLKELPETVCALYNLQTLGIRGCRSLCGLPEGIHKLKNLRHFLNFGTAEDFKYPQGQEYFQDL